ncbi:SDR family NAD(P)-dependent oxidoreductase [Kibdelosporangium aridum]|uniref:NAD(P)-dependent dehydrogenase, short-chain alcohol dehydrogenase family n=1 Tax=Kibdelosporangium aridum TaxID=2030 RepID=A0A1W2FY73_KIBAR|nr:SDR family oxidoreductase [Kibdelosporangium aridum]SMD26578.1 NAD(P)-dependent dehydrogenase, short-chain alcohol dehydrogenase family [Kibdelosporangium aridum]
MSPDPRLHVDLRDRTVVVTGASAGIGVAVAETFGACGANVVLLGRDEQRLRAVAATIEADGGVASPFPVDLTTDDGPQRAVGHAVERFGKIDILVNNAGTFDFKPFDQATVDSLDSQFRSNVRAPFVLTQAALPHLAAGSSVVFVGSNVTAIGWPQTAAYSATKGGVEAMARALSIELAPRGIRVNIVSPGMTRTQMTKRLEDPVLEREALDATPVGAIGEPQDIANAVVFMASDLSRYVLGASLVVDGGYAAC